MVRARFNLSPHYKPWTQPLHRDPPDLRGVPQTARITDLLDLAWAARPPRARDYPWYCDFSQCISRGHYGTIIKTLTTRSRIYDYSQDRVLVGLEAMQLQGSPVLDVDTFMPKLSKMRSV